MTLSGAAPAPTMTTIHHSFSTYVMNAADLEQQVRSSMEYVKDSGKLPGFDWNLAITHQAFNRSYYDLMLHSDDASLLGTLDTGLVGLLKQQGANDL